MDNLTPVQRKLNMQRIKSFATKPEILFAKELKRRKIYFRVNVSTIIGKPDFVFRKKKVVVFVDSCFWHKCPYHYVQPKSNLKYWLLKIDRNKKRDKEVTKRLKEDGWIVFRFWNHQIEKDVCACVNKVIAVM